MTVYPVSNPAIFGSPTTLSPYGVRARGFAPPPFEGFALSDGLAYRPGVDQTKG